MKKKLIEAAKAYEAGKPIMSDSEFDELHTKYKKKNLPISMVTKGSILHGVPMFSMEDFFSVSELQERIAKLTSGLRYLIEPKFDGVSVDLHYRNGILVLALTRGDGVKGNLITYPLEMLNVPLEINILGNVKIRGEAVIAKHNFDYEANSNPRNTVAGIIRTKHKGRIKDLKLEFLPWELILEKNLPTRSEHIKLLTGIFGKEVFGEVRYTQALGIEKVYQHFLEIRDSFPYDMDGIAIKVDSYEVSEKLGVTGMYPKYMFALKFPAVPVKTVVKGITWDIGKTGVYTPVAVFEPINIQGVVITNATLHNYKNVITKGIGAGSTIEVIRSGDVIPYLHKVLTHGRVVIPTNCTYCDSELVKDTTTLRCENKDCHMIKLKQLSYFVSRDGVDIKGLSEKRLGMLIPKYIKSYPDIYKLTEDTLVDVLGKVGTEIYKSIQDSKYQPTSVVLGAVTGAGGKSIHKKIKLNSSYEEMLDIKGIGKDTAKSVHSFLQDNMKMLVELLELAETTIDAEVVDNYVITGTFPIKRKELERILADERGWAKTSGSKATYVIVGTNPSDNKVLTCIKNGALALKYEDLYIKEK